MGLSMPFCINCGVCGYRTTLTSFVRHFRHLSDKHPCLMQSSGCPGYFCLSIPACLAYRVLWVVIFHKYSPRPFRGPKPWRDSACLGGSSRDSQQALHRRASCLPGMQVCSCTDGLQLLGGNQRAFQLSVVFLFSVQLNLFRCTRWVNSPLLPRIEVCVSTRWEKGLAFKLSVHNVSIMLLCF